MVAAAHPFSMFARVTTLDALGGDAVGGVPMRVMLHELAEPAGASTPASTRSTGRLTPLVPGLHARGFSHRQDGTPCCIQRFLCPERARCLLGLSRYKSLPKNQTHLAGCSTGA